MIFRIFFFPLYALLILTLNLSSIDGADPQLVIKEASLFRPTWQTTYVTTQDQCSTWRPLDERFYPLGDILYNKHSTVGFPFPQRTGLMVMDKGDGLVAKPIKTEIVWKEYYPKYESNGIWGVEIVKLIPPPGYTCLGYAAYPTKSYTKVDYSFPGTLTYARPNLLDLYRCVRSDLVSPGQVTRQWSNRDTDNKKHKEFRDPISFWNVESDPLDPTGIPTGLFLSGDGLDVRPTDTPYVLNSTFTTFVESPAEFKDIELVMYETPQVDANITSDTFQGPGDKRLSFTRANEVCCHLGFAVNGYYWNVTNSIEIVQAGNKKPAFYAREIKPKMLAKPTDFQQIWNNEKGKGKWYVAFYKVICPRGFVALGHMVTRGEKDFVAPSADNFRCVHLSLVTKGKWTKVWDSKDVPGVGPVTVWRADAASNAGVDASLFSAVTRFGEMDTPAYVLKRNKVQVNWGKRVTKLELSNEVYDFEKKKVINKTPMDLSRTIVNNCGGTTDLKASKSFEFTKETEFSWKFEVSIEIGIEYEMTVTVPFVSATKRFSLKFGVSYGQESRYKESKKETITSEITVPAGSKAAFYVKLDKSVADIPWVADSLTTFADGSTSQGKVAGNFIGIEFSEAEVIGERPVPCSPKERKEAAKLLIDEQKMRTLHIDF